MGKKFLNNIKYFINLRLYLLTVFFYFCAVSNWQIFRNILGTTDWHRVMFEIPFSRPLFDWWTWLIPCFIVSFVLVNFVPKKLAWFTVGATGVLTAIWITLSYF